MVSGMSLVGVNTPNLNNQQIGKQFERTVNMAMRLSSGDMFSRNWTSNISKEDMATLEKLHRDIDNCKREDFESEEEYQKTLNGRIKAYNDFKAKLQEEITTGTERQLSAFERIMKALGGFAKDIGEAINKGGELFVELFRQILHI